ncbi:MAG: glutathione S-transferase N-terminal domain-containing protein [Legionella sp.]|nr:glutathione S-transferase N-terminal domain-containing protein [Legionella sp.]
MTYPILYSFRRCPYAIRARMALRYADITVRIREVELKNKTASMLIASPKGTVPILQLEEGQVIDESLQIMFWALTQSDPDGWLKHVTPAIIRQWIETNDVHFKPLLDGYKYTQYSEKQNSIVYRDHSMPYLQSLNDVLIHHQWLLGENMSIVDVALFPFVRQFSMVDPDWFWKTALTGVHAWLQCQLDSDLFTSVMKKYKPWTGESEDLL